MSNLELIYREYQRMRRSGKSTQETLSSLKMDIQGLTRGEKEVLRNRVRQWENDFTNSHPIKVDAETAPDAQATTTEAPVTTPMPDKPQTADPDKGAAATSTSQQDVQDAETRRVQPDSDKSILAMLDDKNTQMLEDTNTMWLECHNCSTRVREADVFCYNCGVSLEEPTAEKVQTRHFNSAGAEVYSPDFFGNESVLVLDLINTVGRFELRPQLRSGSLTIGRVTPQTSGGRPTIDLEKAQGDELGVSRMHLEIVHNTAQRTLVVKDLGSSNGTFVNDQRLLPQTPHTLRTGDKLRLGRLIMMVTYVHPGEEII